MWSTSSCSRAPQLTHVKLSRASTVYLHRLYGPVRTASSTGKLLPWPQGQQSRNMDIRRIVRRFQCLGSSRLDSARQSLKVNLANLYPNFRGETTRIGVGGSRATSLVSTDTGCCMTLSKIYHSYALIPSGCYSECI